MDNDNDHERRVTKRVRISLPNASGVLSAVVVLAALLTLARRSRQSLKNARSGLVVLGVAGVGIAKLLRAYGVERVLGSDLQAEAVVATTGAPDCIRLELVRRGQAILALSHAEPEISPEAALAVGARCAADGQTLSSALAFPGRLRGALDARISRFTDAMKLAAAAGIARQANEAALMPAVLDPVLHPRVAQAVGDAAQRERTLVGRTPAALTRQEVHYAAR